MHMAGSLPLQVCGQNKQSVVEWMCTTGTLEVSCMSCAITPGKSCKICPDMRPPAARDSAFRKNADSSNRQVRRREAPEGQMTRAEQAGEQRSLVTCDDATRFCKCLTNVRQLRSVPLSSLIRGETSLARRSESLEQNS